jgi:hypothetical protein
MRQNRIPFDSELIKVVGSRETTCPQIDSGKEEVGDVRMA